jgi:hypothetical protein
MILMVQLRDQRIADKDHESEAVMLVMSMTVLAISRDLIAYTCLSKSRSGSLLRPLFANLRSAFAFVSDDMAAACSALCVKKSERTLADGRNCEKLFAKRTWVPVVVRVG